MLALCGGFDAYAADATWNVNAGGNWSSGGNWSGGNAPGATTGTANADTATFGTAITAARAVTNDANYNVGSIVFSNSSAFGYTLTNNSLLLSSGGSILQAGTGSAHTDTVASAVAIQGDGGTASFLNNSSGSTLTISGGVSGVSTSGKTTTLTIGGTATGVTNIISGAITNGSGGGSLAIVKTGAGIWSLNKSNSFTGGVQLLEGTLRNTDAYGYGTGAITMGALGSANNMTLDLSGANASSGSVIVAPGTGTATIRSTYTNSVRLVSKIVSVVDEVNVDVGANASLQFNDSFTGHGNIIKTGAGTISVGADNWRGGDNKYVVQEGTMNVSKASGLSLKNAIELSNGTLLNIATNSSMLNVGGLHGAGNVVIATTNASGSTSTRVGGSGNYILTGGWTNVATNAAPPTKYQLVIDMGGSQTFAGGLSLNMSNLLMRAGTLALDYTANNSSKIDDSAVLTLFGGTLDLKGGTTAGTYHDEVVASTVLNEGASTISQSSGSSTVNLGAITLSGGALNITKANIAKTANANDATGIISRRITVAGSDWAANDGSSNIVAYTGYTTFDSSVTTGSSATNYRVIGSASGWTTNATTITNNTLKIDTAGGGALNATNKALRMDGLLVTGDGNYTIQSASLGGATSFSLHNYGTGTLTLATAIYTGLNPSTFLFAGTGYTVLTKNAIGRTAVSIGSGSTVEFSSDAQLSDSSLGGLALYGGRLIANTTSSDITMTRTLTVNGGASVVDIIGSGTLTFTNLIQNNTVNNLAGSVSLTFGSSSTTGKFVITSTNSGTSGFASDFILGGGTVSIANATNISRDLAGAWIDFNGGTLQTTANVDLGTNRSLLFMDGAVAKLAPDTNTTVTFGGVTRGAGALMVNGAGTVTLSGTNLYTGNTTIAKGTLKLGANANIDYSPVINVGTTNSPGTLDLTANSSYAFGSSQKVSGNGTINIGSGKTVTLAGTLAPGNSPGTITINGDAAWVNGASYDWEILNLADNPGTSWDLLSITNSGTLNLTGLTAGGYTINLITLSAETTQGELAGFTSSATYTNWLIARASDIIGFEAGNFALNTTSFANPYSGTFAIMTNTLAGGGKGLFLTYTGGGAPIPEPGTWATAALLAATAGLIKWRRRCRA